MKHYYNKQLVSVDDVLPKKNNMHYRDLDNGIYEVYSYETLIGYVIPEAKAFIEWASIVHYSVTTSVQATVLFNKLVSMGVVNKRVAMDKKDATAYIEQNY